MEFAEVRSYEIGDDYRTIDWNVSARLGHPYVKTFTEERELTVLLVLDHSGSTRFGEPQTKSALSDEVAAVLALAAARQSDRVGALRFSDRVEQVVPPRKGRKHALRVIRDLVAFQPAGRKTDLAASLTYALRLLHHRSIIVVLSDFLAQGWERPLRRLTARHEVVAITVDEPRERELPASGWLELEDAETGQRVLVDAGNREVRSRHTSLAERQLGDRRRALAAAGVDHLALVTRPALPLPCVPARPAHSSRMTAFVLRIISQLSSPGRRYDLAHAYRDRRRARGPGCRVAAGGRDRGPRTGSGRPPR
jgi:uncharacterized protein (DUF58 family)